MYTQITIFSGSEARVDGVRVPDSNKSIQKIRDAILSTDFGLEFTSQYTPEQESFNLCDESGQEQSIPSEYGIFGKIFRLLNHFNWIFSF